MTEQRGTPHLTIKTAEAADWSGEIIIAPEIALKESKIGKPGKKPGDTVFVSGEPHSLIVSLGGEKKLSTASIRKAGIAVAKWLVSHEIGSAGLKPTIFNNLDIEEALGAFCEGLLLGAFQFDRYKSEENGTSPVEVVVIVDGNKPVLQTKIDRVIAILTGVNLARELSHEPPNIINPVTLAKRTQELAADKGLTCKIFGEGELTELGAGAIISVGLGSKTPSQMIVVEYPGHGVGVGTPPVVVVGKAITFDTGGYSLKNTKGIVGMKFDKCGGMAVLGIMDAVVALNLPVPVIGIVAAAENMISSYAYRPNDIITSLSGKTIEIISTDAEGRMVLSDALTYASTELNPRAIIDLATLTGGVLVALGKNRAGLMSNDDELADALAASGDRTDERLWRLPLDEEYFELIKGSDSDLKNSAGAPLASSIVGGTFLKQFVMNEVPWAHIDIAGTAWVESGPNHGMGATGFGVRLIVDYLEKIML
jgi:leucyl aminopeptidase